LRSISLIKRDKDEAVSDFNNPDLKTSGISPSYSRISL